MTRALSILLLSMLAALAQPFTFSDVGFMGHKNTVAPPSCTVYDSTYYDKANSTLEKFGYDATYYQVGQSPWTPASGTKHICQIDARFTKTLGSIAGKSYYCKITLLSGTSLSTIQGTSDAVAGSDSWSASTVSFVFSTPVAVTAGTGYAIVFYTSAASSTSNYASLVNVVDGVQTDGQYYRLWDSNGAQMDSVLGLDASIKIYTND